MSIARLGQHEQTALVKADEQAEMVKFGCCVYSEYCSGTIALALFIIACVSAAGVLSPAAAGGTIVGLSVPLLIQNMGKVHTGRAIANRRTEPNVHARNTAILRTIISLVGIVLGSLAVAGVMSPFIAAVTVLSLGVVSYCGGCLSDYMWGNSSCADGIKMMRK